MRGLCDADVSKRLGLLEINVIVRLEHQELEEGACNGLASFALLGGKKERKLQLSFRSLMNDFYAPTQDH